MDGIYSQKQRFNLGMLSECPGSSEESYLRTCATLGIKKQPVLYGCHFSRRKLGERWGGKPGVGVVKQIERKKAGHNFGTTVQ